jgi:hypothetical protein
MRVMRLSSVRHLDSSTDWIVPLQCRFADIADQKHKNSQADACTLFQAECFERQHQHQHQHQPPTTNTNTTSTNQNGGALGTALVGVGLTCYRTYVGVIRDASSAVHGQAVVDRLAQIASKLQQVTV